MCILTSETVGPIYPRIPEQTQPGLPLQQENKELSSRDTDHLKRKRLTETDSGKGDSASTISGNPPQDRPCHTLASNKLFRVSLKWTTANIKVKDQEREQRKSEETDNAEVKESCQETVINILRREGVYSQSKKRMP